MFGGDGGEGGGGGRGGEKCPSFSEDDEYFGGHISLGMVK